MEHSTDGPTIEALTYDYTKNGVLLRKQVDKKVLNRSATWASVLFVHRDRKSPETDEWKPPKATLVRYRLKEGMWQKQGNGFNINDLKQLDAMISALREMRPHMTSFCF